MNFTKRQIALLTTALCLFYDEVSKTAPPEFKEEVMDLVEMFESAYEESESLSYKYMKQKGEQQ